jgi:cytochrome c biogenesis protein ResB
VWLFPAEGTVLGGESLGFLFMNPTSAKDIDFSPVTGLEVSFEPGQWLVWGGCLLMGVGLFVAFYTVHMRVWVSAVTNAEGRLVLWVGGACNKNRDRFEQKFVALTDEIRHELEISTPATRYSALETENPQLDLAGVK